MYVFNLLDNAKLFPKVLVPIYILIHSTAVIDAPVSGGKVTYLTEALLGISLKTDKVEWTPFICWSFGYPLFGILSLIFLWDCLSMRYNI